MSASDISTGLPRSGRLLKIDDYVYIVRRADQVAWYGSPSSCVSHTWLAVLTGRFTLLSALTRPDGKRHKRVYVVTKKKEKVRANWRGFSRRLNKQQPTSLGKRVLNSNKITSLSSYSCHPKIGKSVDANWRCYDYDVSLHKSIQLVY